MSLALMRGSNARKAATIWALTSGVITKLRGAPLVAFGVSLVAFGVPLVAAGTSPCGRGVEPVVASDGPAVSLTGAAGPETRLVVGVQPATVTAVTAVRASAARADSRMVFLPRDVLPVMLTALEMLAR